MDSGGSFLGGGHLEERVLVAQVLVGIAQERVAQRFKVHEVQLREPSSLEAGGHWFLVGVVELGEVGVHHGALGEYGHGGVSLLVFLARRLLLETHEVHVVPGGSVERVVIVRVVVSPSGTPQPPSSPSEPPHNEAASPGVACHEASLASLVGAGLCLTALPRATSLASPTLFPTMAAAILDRVQRALIKVEGLTVRPVEKTCEQVEEPRVLHLLPDDLASPLPLPARLLLGLPPHSLGIGDLVGVAFGGGLDGDRLVDAGDGGQRLLLLLLGDDRRVAARGEDGGVALAEFVVAGGVGADLSTTSAVASFPRENLVLSAVYDHRVSLYDVFHRRTDRRGPARVWRRDKTRLKCGFFLTCPPSLQRRRVLGFERLTPYLRHERKTD